MARNNNNNKAGEILLTISVRVINDDFFPDNSCRNPQSSCLQFLRLLMNLKSQDSLNISNTHFAWKI